MKIDKPAKPIPNNMIGETTQRTPVSKSGAAPQQQASTNVSLGSTATQLNKMEASMANTPVADAGKVAEIKQAISEGRFQVNSSAVADGLIASVRDLINNSKVQ